jgi:hypothetical protein
VLQAHKYSFKLFIKPSAAESVCVGVLQSGWLKTADPRLRAPVPPEAPIVQLNPASPTSVIVSWAAVRHATSYVQKQARQRVDCRIETAQASLRHLRASAFGSNQRLNVVSTCPRVVSAQWR